MAEFADSNMAVEKFMAFQIGGVNWLLSVMDLVHIEDKAPEEVPFILPSGSRWQYCVLVRSGGELLALGAETIEGLAEIPAACQFELPAECRCEANRYISGVAYREDSGQLAFLLDPHLLSLQKEEESHG